MKISLKNSATPESQLNRIIHISRLASYAAVVLALTSTHAFASGSKHHASRLKSQVFSRPLDIVNFSDGINYNTTLTFSTGIGSGAFHYPGDDSNTVYTVGDRGVNVKCKDDISVFGGDVCKKGKIFPVLNYAPSIFKLQKQHKKGWVVTQVIQLKDSNGKQISGLPNPFTSMATENAYDNKGNTLGFDASGLDTEAMVRLSDGSFWISDEYAPSLVHVSATGEILERLVPAGIEDELSKANYPVTGLLPEILSKRKLNRGIESIAVSPNEDFIYFIMQSPLANPGKSAYKKSRNVRLFKMDLKNKEVIAEYVYVIDTPDSFLADNTSKQSKVKVSEMVAYGDNKLIILERISKTTKLFKVTLDDASNILNTQWDNVVTSPSLEEVDLNTADITPMEKELALDSATDLKPGALPSKVEGVAILNDHELFLVNDNDFGIEGASTYLINLKVAEDFFE